jgi:hypothetical protein
MNMTSTALERAKADLAETKRQISLLDAEKLRIDQKRNSLAIEAGKITAFIDLFDRYVEDPELAETPQPVEVVQQTEPEPAAVQPVGSASGAAKILKRGKQQKGHRRSKILRKPTGIPAITDLIVAALEDAVDSGKPGLTPKDMTAFIVKHYWPHARSSSISPIAWRMFDRKQLRKEGDLYMLPEVAATPAAEVDMDGFKSFGSRETENLA